VRDASSSDEMGGGAAGIGCPRATTPGAAFFDKLAMKK
jgi:hypothetical protein